MELRQIKRDQPNPFSGPVRRRNRRLHFPDLCVSGTRDRHPGALGARGPGGAPASVFLLKEIHQGHPAGFRLGLGALHDNLVDQSKPVLEHIRTRRGRGLAPNGSKLGVLRMLNDELCFGNGQAGAHNKFLHVPDSEKPDMRAIQESGVAISKILIQQAGQHSAVSCVWKREEQIAVPGDQSLHPIQCRPRIVEVLEHVRRDYNVEAAGIGKAGRPGPIVEVDSVDGFAYGLQPWNRIRIGLYGGNAAVEFVTQNARDRAWPGANVEHALVPTDHLNDAVRRRTVAEFNFVVVPVTHLRILLKDGTYGFGRLSPMTFSARKPLPRRFPKVRTGHRARRENR